MRLLVATVLLSLALPACEPSPGPYSAPFLAHGCMTITDRATCMAPLELSAPVQSRGTIDAALAAEYRCTVLVEDTSLPSPIEVVSLDVELIDASTLSDITRFSSPTSASLSTSTPLGAADVLLIDAASLANLRQKVIATGTVQQVVARFWLVGRLGDGREVEAPPVDYPIDIRVDTSCVSPAGGACFGDQATPVADCRLGVDEPAGTSCQAIAGMLGPCGHLECDTVSGKSVLASARCPSHVPPNDSCCHP